MHEPKNSDSWLKKWNELKKPSRANRQNEREKKKTDEEFFQQHTGNASFGSARGTGMLGNPTGDVLIVAQTEGKAHWHNILRGSANCLHPRERFILLEIEKWYNKYMKEEDYIHSTLLPALTHSCWSCCNGSRGSSSFFSLLLVTSLSALSQFSQSCSQI